MMPRQMGRPSNRAERRAEIVAAFRTVLGERGYAGTTIAEVARAAGLRQGLLHYHFESKQEILLALLEALASGIEARVQARTASSTTPRAALLAFVDAHVALGDDADPSAVASWVTLGVEAVHQAEVRQAYSAAVDAELNRLEALVAADQPHADPARVARISAGIYATIQGAYHLATTVPSRVPPGFAAEILRDWLSRD
jgi:TetR/AcrR family transcriptional repressor of bet genes